MKIGALEVQMCVKQKKQNKITLLHSKLRTRQWPNIKNILEKIVVNLPLVNIQLSCYDREKESVNNVKGKQNQSKDDFKISKYDKMKVNIYLLKIPQINQLTRSTADGMFN